MMLQTSNNQNRILNTLSTTLPDDRPITAIQIVEYADKCPRGFVAISKTYDQDQDADLWREVSFLKRSKCGRYLCLSKSEGIPSLVIQDIAVVNEKEAPPKGYSLLGRTADTEQKAWRKKQLCYRLVNGRDVKSAITDIIVCNRLKRAPYGFSLAGEINGMTICYKMGNIQDTPAPAVSFPTTSPQLSDSGDYELLLPGYAPNRPAPPRPAPAAGQVAPLGPHFGLEGVPFVLSRNLMVPGGHDARETGVLPAIKTRTMSQLNRDYDYDFRTERRS